MSPAAARLMSESFDPTGQFMVAPPPLNESQRLQLLHEYEVLDTAAEHAFDDLARLAALCCKTPIALISLVDGDRQWFKARFGTHAIETPREHSFCAHAILNPDEVMVVPDTHADRRFAGNPLVTGEPHIGFYAGAPLVSPTGEAIGSLCVIDSRPRQMDAEQIEMLRALSRQVIAQLEMRRSLRVLESAIHANQGYVTQLEHFQQRLQRRQAKLEHENATDVLTGVGNRRGFQERLEDELLHAARTDGYLSLMLLDVDFFKRYNDSFGHPAGDRVLAQLGTVLARSCRNVDFAARIGGEEFAVILPATSSEGALVIAERVRRAVQNETWPNRSVTISVGATVAVAESDTPASLIERADRALYSAKQDGRNRVVVY